MICTDPADVLAFIASSPAGQDATPAQRMALEEAVAARFAEEGGQMTITKESGCFVANAMISPREVRQNPASPCGTTPCPKWDASIGPSSP